MSSGVYSDSETWAAAIVHAFNCPESEREEAFLRLYTRDTVFVVDKNRMNFDEFLSYAKTIIDIVTSVEVNIHHWVTDGKLFASLHTTVAHMKDGSTTKVYPMAMGEIGEDGKATWIEERPQFLEAENPEAGKGEEK